MVKLLKNKDNISKSLNAERRKASKEYAKTNDILIHDALKKDNLKRSDDDGLSTDQKFKKFAENLIAPFNEYILKDANDRLRPVRTDNPRRQTEIVIRHYFQKYRVPSHFEEVWHSRKDTTECKTRIAYYMTLAQGGSLYKEHLKDYLTRKEVHLLSSADYDLTFQQMIWYVIAKSYNDNHGFCLKIARSKISTRPISSSMVFWRDAVRLFATEKSTIPISTINDMFDYFSHMIGRDSSYSVKKRTFHSLMKNMHDWHRDLARLKKIGVASWDGIDIDNFEVVTDEDEITRTKWTIRQIKNSQELQLEGNAMRHCVLTYMPYCRSGACSIWSLKSENSFDGEKRRLTIEMNENGSLIQIRGYANRLMTGEERQILMKWTRSDHRVSL